MIRWLPPLFVAGLFPFLVGCGSGTYEEAFQKSLQKTKGLAGFTMLGKNPLKIGDTPVSVRLPKDLGGTIYDKNSRSPDDSKAAPHPVRLRPEVLANLPGWVYTVEKGLRDEKNLELPVSCAIFVLDMNELKGKADERTKSIKNTVKERYRDAAWETAEVATPSGTHVKWEKLSATESQEFLVKAEGARPTRQQVEGQAQFWLHQSPPYVVLLAWRVPEPIEGSFKLDEFAPLTAGTIEIGERPAAGE